MLKTKAKRQEAAPGMQAGIIELASGDSYKVRLLDGTLLDASLAPGVGAALAEECLRDRRTVLLSCVSSGTGVILGALQTAPSAATRDVDDNVALSAAEASVEAENVVTLRAGDTALQLHADGRVRLVGQQLTMDIAALIKLLSAKVELP